MTERADRDIVHPRTTNANSPAKTNMETKKQNEDQTEALKREYQAVIKLNETFTAVNDNLIGARGKLQQFANTIDQTDTLLDIWIKVLSQSLHTQRLLSDPSWQGQTTVAL
ncbi:223_t:CDS:2 [Paraglomus brasilianum]|uniref:DASH complex subunit DUO1 n=1 Tax=Paraglomus brasilianum TaxID=144538 RepID=A0A9N8ZFV3_9GLOM|nr:223_t:CDS:2 [Paraglomus brasilianum]